MSKVKESAFRYLKEKQRSKGKDYNYQELNMSEYLLPTNKKLIITEKQTMFTVKNRTVRIPANFPKDKTDYKCICNEKEEMHHIFIVTFRKMEEKPTWSMKSWTGTGTISEQIEIMRQFERNMEEREKLLKEESSPRDPSVIHCIRQSIVMD